MEYLANSASIFSTFQAILQRLPELICLNGRLSLIFRRVIVLYHIRYGAILVGEHLAALQGEDQQYDSSYHRYEAQKPAEARMPCIVKAAEQEAECRKKEHEAYNRGKNVERYEIAHDIRIIQSRGVDGESRDARAIDSA